MFSKPSFSQMTYIRFPSVRINAVQCSCSSKELDAEQLQNGCCVLLQGSNSDGSTPCKGLGGLAALSVLRTCSYITAGWVVEKRTPFRDLACRLPRAVSTQRTQGDYESQTQHRKLELQTALSFFQDDSPIFFWFLPFF
ncbi:hypothetical protein RvY_19190 [Ramazzottius varieornatus]|uniref:Uncharacterized protein n=1 Tax=Ramazzottius varieornatus TaxID=947166 RepID=A0A1D1W9U1_RAMVA|nr:hypothetical protein RvY_19190 [Ramazzottius varieornatus]